MGYQLNVYYICYKIQRIVRNIYMNKKRISQRKSELRLNIEDFCLGISENTDPIIGYLLTILQWQASLDIQTNSILHAAFNNQIEELKCKLKLQLKYLKNKTEENQIHNKNIAKYINQFHKLKQVFSYCLILTKRKSELCEELQKFNQYTPISVQLTEQLENYLNEPIIFQTIFHSYLRAYNINILTADLISFLYGQHQQKWENKGQKYKVQINRWTNEDVEMLKTKTIIFKQLTTMDRKYFNLQKNLQNSYVSFVSNDFSQFSSISNSFIVNPQQQTNLKHKLKKLDHILSKIKNEPRLYSIDKTAVVLLEVQSLSSLRTLHLKNDHVSLQVIELNKQFFLETFYGKTWSQMVIGDQEFNFLRQKIIKIEALTFLNRIIAATNVISYVYNQLDLQVRQFFQFQFKNLRKLIGSQFIKQQLFETKATERRQKTAFFSLDPSIKTYCVYDSQNNKVLFPSAINYFICFIKNMLSTTFQDKFQILDILAGKSQYMEALADTILNIYEIIKVKQLTCYRLLRQYIEIIIKSCCWNNLGSYSSFEDMMETINIEKQKIGIISQIIEEFDHNYSIKQALQQLYRIQFDGLTKNCISTFQLYKLILYEIIEIRNGLKLDHYFSVNQIHEKFSLLPHDIDKMDNDKKGKIRQVYFEDIIHEICNASQTNLYLPKLFFFFDLQLKFKRIVFKLQLCWSGHRQLIFDKKTHAFRQFLNNYCQPIFEIVNQSHNIVEILENMQQIQRYTQIFSEEVSRFHLVQKLVSSINNYKDVFPFPSLRENLNRFGKKDLEELHTTLNTFNPVESQKFSSKIKLIQNISKNISKYGSLKISELPNYCAQQVRLKEKLASIIYIMNILPSHAADSDHINIVNLYHFRDSTTKLNLNQLKINEKIEDQYQQWLKSSSIQLLVKHSQEIFVLGIINTLRQMSKQGEKQSSQDYKKLIKLMKRFELSSLFLNLSRIQEIQFWREQFGILTKYHQIYQLMFHLDCFTLRIGGSQGKKFVYKNRTFLNQQNHKVDFNNTRSDFITKLYYIFGLKPLTRQKLQKNIQRVESEVEQVQSVHKQILKYHERLKKVIYRVFCQQIEIILDRVQLKEELGIKFESGRKPTQYIQLLKENMLKVVKEYKILGKDENISKFVEIEMFREKKGYELSMGGNIQHKQFKIATKKRIERTKKPMISPHRLQEDKNKPLQDLKRNYKIDMLKKSIQLRKQLSQLQIKQSKIREQIVWETSKLEDSVVKKINEFIALSNIDQQQSYTNFKHTVNIQTIKGIENVIEQQTQMYMEKKNAALESEKETTFVTEIEKIDEKDNEFQQKVDRSRKLLQANVESILIHMKKIRLFSAWKRMLKKTDLTKKQWCNFNMNVQNILNNQKINLCIDEIEELRNKSLSQSVVCEIIKEQNLGINEKIQQLKLNNLEKKIKSYKQRLLNN